MERFGWFVADEEIGAACKIAENFADPRHLALPSDSGEGESPPVEEFPQGVPADIDAIFPQQFGLDPFHPVLRVFGQDGFDLYFEREVLISHSLFRVNGDVIGTLGDPKEITDPVDSK